MHAPNRHLSTAMGILAAPLLLLALLPGQVEAQGLTYTLVPSARWIDWDDGLDFDRSRLLGGGVTIGFGRYVGLTAFYHQDDDATPLPGGDLRMELVQAGGDVTLAFGTSTIVPVVKGGASIIRFRPEDDALDDFTKLAFDYGAGLRAVFSETITGEVMVESSEYRLAPERLTGDPVPSEEPIRHNLSLRAGLGIQLGSRTSDRAEETDRAMSRSYDSPFDNFAIAIEPGFSRFTFDDELAIGDQDAWGGRVGFDFGSFFGLRGMYWHGTEEDELGDFSDFTAWGGEAQFNLGAGPGVNPYLLAGVTHFAWESDDPMAQRIDGRNAVTLGAGIDLDVSDRFRLTVAARDNILAGADIGGDLIEGVSDPDDLIHNWQFTAGFGVVLGEGTARGAARDRQREMDDQQREMDDRQREMDREREERMERAARTEREGGRSADAGAGTARSDTIEVELPRSRDTRTIVLPVLEEGEVYIRFGPAGPTRLGSPMGVAPDSAVSEEVLRRLIREELRSLTEERTDTSMLEVMSELEALERRLQARLDRIGRMEGGRETTVVTTAEQGEARPSVSRESRELRPYAGLATSGGTQLLVGVAADIGPLWGGSAFNVVPQVAFGIGEGKPSVLLNASVEYRFSDFDVGEGLRFTPIVSAGPSLVHRGGLDIRLSTFLGSGLVLLDDSGGERINLFAGYQGVDFLGEGRLLIGLRLLR